MKKRYITPETESINYMPVSAMLIPSLETETDPTTDNGNEATGSVRGDWDNIWKEM